MDNLDFLGGRKFVLTVLFFIALFVLTVLGKTSVDQWLDGAKWVLTGFFAANAVASFASKDN